MLDMLDGFYLHSHEDHGWACWSGHEYPHGEVIHGYGGSPEAAYANCLEKVARQLEEDMGMVYASLRKARKLELDS